jgi:hypothetical protein
MENASQFGFPCGAIFHTRENDYGAHLQCKFVTLILSDDAKFGESF